MTAMTLTDRAPRFTLKQVLGFDALTCAAFGALLTIGAAPLAGLLALPQSLLFYAGLVLFPCAALMWITARTLAKPLVWTVILGNVAWVVASIAVLFVFEPNMLGVAFVIAQAVVVDVLAVMEWKRR
jgi:hypothetical protein